MEPGTKKDVPMGTAEGPFFLRVYTRLSQARLWRHCLLLWSIKRVPTVMVHLLSNYPRGWSLGGVQALSEGTEKVITHSYFLGKENTHIHHHSYKYKRRTHTT